MKSSDKKYLLGVTAFFMALVFAFHATADNSFTRETYGSASGNPLNAYAVSHLLYSSATCTLVESGRFTSNSTSSFTLNYEFFAPHLTSKGTGYIAGLEDASCLGMGEITGITDSNQSRYEARIYATHGATISNTGYIKSTLSCTTPSNTATIGSNGEKDSQGYLVNLYGNTASGYSLSGWTVTINALIAARRAEFETFYIDKEASDCVSAGKATSGGASGLNNWAYNCVMETLPFNSGGEGKASIKILPPSATVINGAPSSGSYVEYFPVENPSEAVIVYNSGNWIAGSGAFTPMTIEQNLTLTPDKDYVIVSYYCGAGAHGVDNSIFTFTKPKINLTYSVYNPDWNCTGWGECASGYQTRTCTDLNGIANSKIESRSCFETPTVEVNLGFEAFTSGADDTFLCGKTWLICSDLLQSKDSSLPNGWYIDRTYATTWLGETAALENFCEGSAETAFTGSKSLKCWSLPPGSGQPLATNTFLGDDVVCGDYNQTREPEVVGLFNESLFISYNVSFATPYVNLHWATKKCSSSPTQYKYGDCLGCCGDKCYGDCNQTPTGWYTIKMADIGTGIHGYQNYPYTAMRYSPYLDPTVLDYTESASALDLDSTIINLNYWEEGEYSTLTLAAGNFTNEMTIAFRVLPYFGSTDATVYLTDVTGNTVYGSFTLPSSIFSWVWRNVTLQNMTGLFGEGTNIIYIHEPIDNIPASIVFYVDYIAIETYEEFVEVETLFEFDEEATSDWSQKMLDLTNLGIVPNHNYTIGFKISPQYETTASNCLYFDDVTGTYTESTVSVCSSYCDGYRLYEAREHGEICLFSITENSPICRGVSESERYDSFCEGTTLNYFNNATGFWYLLENATECFPSEGEIVEAALYDPPEWLIPVMASLIQACDHYTLSNDQYTCDSYSTPGLTAAEWEAKGLGLQWFLASTFMIINYLAIILGLSAMVLPILVSSSKQSVTIHWEIGAIVMLIIIASALFSGFYPPEIGIVILVVIALILYYEFGPKISGKS